MKTVRVGLVVDQLGVDMNISGILQSRGAAGHKVANSIEEGL